MGSLAYREDLEEEKNSAFTWELEANSRDYNSQFKEKSFLCWQRRKHKSNVIHTAKYNVFSFLPLNLYEQFHRVSNLYFLFIIILQGLPEISTLPWFTLFVPLICLLVIRATRDLVDDIGRHRSDRIINNRPCQTLVGKSFLWRKWEDLYVGDVVCLHKDNIVPADLLLLASTEPSSLCYVETADIDGETNLKFRQAPPVTHHELTSIRKMASFQGFDTKIMRNCGKIHLKRSRIDRLLNRLVALVRRPRPPPSSSGPPFPSCAKIFLSLVLISVALSLGFWSKVKEFKAKHHYVSPRHVQSVAAETFLTFWGFFILLSVMVPMAMFIMVEFIYLGNSMFINWDVHMYYAPQDVPAKARSTSLNDQLGQVGYVFSDKTGTLTQNVMTFKKCCIAGIVYGPDDEEEAPCKGNPYLWNKFADGKFPYRNAELLRAVRGRTDEAVREFWRLLAICHTVMVQEKDPDQPVYQAASPDEEALVTAARNFGYVFVARTQDSITVMELGDKRVYQVLAMMDFNSMRKRMSVLVRNPEGAIYLYTKGADVVIFERLSKKGMTEWTTEEALASFAEETLRTLCLAYKRVDEDTYEEWRQRHREASLRLQNRAHALHQVYEEMEKGLQLLGATAIEDRLQDGVCDTIQCLKQGNIKVWVLTGDKQETAVNIGFACQLLSENMLILEEKEITRILEAYWGSNDGLLAGQGLLQSRFLQQTKVAMIINGEFLDQLLLSLRKEPRALVRDEDVDVDVDVEEAWQERGERTTDFLRAQRVSLMWRTLGIQLRGTGLGPRVKDSGARDGPEVRRERAFVELAARCQAVICCRVTPKQKALIVALVKKYQRAVTLAIGDGANDVNMIKTADVGVGLAGPESMQAVQNSDYALAQFCFLKRLLLVHGRWSYVRVCKFLRYFVYKTLASMMAQVWFAFYSGFTAQPLYEGWFLALFNLLFSTLPVLYIGLFEQDVSAERSLELPQLYIAGQKDELFNYWVFLQALAHGTATSLVNFFVTLWVSHDSAGPTSFSDYQSFSVVVALSSLLSITMEAILIIKYWTVLSVLAIFLSFCFYVVVTWGCQSFWLFQISPENFPFLYADRNVLSHPSILLVILLNVSLNTLPTLALRVIYQALEKPRPKEVEEAPSEDITAVEPAPYLRRESRRRRSSYAFSHREGYAELITQGTILRRAPGVDNDMLMGQIIPCHEELSPSIQESPRCSRKMSLLGKTGHQHRGKVSSRDGGRAARRPQIPSDPRLPAGAGGPGRPRRRCGGSGRSHGGRGGGRRGRRGSPAPPAARGRGGQGVPRGVTARARGGRSGARGGGAAPPRPPTPEEQ
ncbi:phospholipid-transporting ATPase IK isoform X7 [Panthera uncia]|uniref:phospholipid-transporting ATPase IK isoform X7 n=1 Tax=Panthera uncia TaxID=29064 RepID=UPI0020FFC52F|nr:phospholipid-transporting ATPase IK isoform X7 [Panthera uncia]